MNFDSILAITDFTAPSEQALDRAALLASQHGAPLRLIYFAEEAHRFFSDPLARLSQRARQLARRHRIPVHAMQRHPLTVEDILAESRTSSLLVVGPVWRRRWTSLFLATGLDHLVRGSGCPVLVVKQAAPRVYANVLVAVDLSSRSGDLIDYAHRLANPSKVKLFHAINTVEESRLRMADVASETLRAHRLDSRHRARERLVQLTSTLQGNERVVSVDVGNGDPAYQAAVEQQATRAELVVVGQRRAPTLARWFMGSVAQRLARWAEGDVLIVPLDRLGESVPVLAGQG